MELPKNITQIGESDRSCKIYVEDYVTSYIKQMNRLAESRQLAVALYGVRKEEQEVSYLFFYGACKLDTLGREVRHMSQAQNQEIEKLRKHYFPNYEFLGYRLLNGEMVEGFHVCEQGICRYINGYACFYEKNDSMLAYMLDSREEEPVPEEVNQDKYEQVKQRQEARRQQHEEENRSGRSRRDRTTRNEEQVRDLYQEIEEEEKEPVDTRKEPAILQEAGTSRRRAREDRATARTGKREKPKPAASSKTLRIMRGGVVGMFALLCIVGLTTLNGYGKLEQLQVAAKQLFEEFTEKKIPDASDAVAVINQSNQADTLVAEDKLADAIASENQSPGQQDPQASIPPSEPAADNPDPGNDTQNGVPPENAGQEPVQDNTSPDNTSPDNASPVDNPQGDTNQTGTGQEGQQAGSQAPPEEPASANGGQANGDPGSTQGNTGQDNAEPSQPPAETPSQPEPEVQPASSPTTYTIKPGDTLIGICTRMYGSDSRVKEVCSMNNISNPDNIRIGQKILLPQ